MDKSANNYAKDHSEAYLYVFGKNSNTFAQTVIDECDFDCDLPPSAVGADNTYLPSITPRDCTIRAEIGMGTGVTIGLTQITAEIGGMPVGISSEGIHCLVTISWPWNWF